jgi:myo-inositol 2-dehydrogenase/D-chiro-inositol 1-dehydrogenase
MGSQHLANVVAHPDVSKTTVIDADPRRARAAERSWGAVIGRSVDSVLEEADAIIIASPTRTHYRYTRESLLRGIPTFCEKPTSLSLLEAQDIVELVEGKKGILQVGFHRRFDAAYKSAQADIAGGALGRVCCFQMGAHDRTSPAPWPDFFIALHIHDFDTIRFLFSSEVEAICALGATQGFPGHEEVEETDTSAFLLRLEDGILGTLTGSRYNMGGYDVRAEVFGSRKSISVGLTARSPLHPAAEESTRERSYYSDYLDRFQDAYRAEINHFLESARGRATAFPSGHDSYEALRVGMAADLSRREGRLVHLLEFA